MAHRAPAPAAPPAAAQRTPLQIADYRTFDDAGTAWKGKGGGGGGRWEEQKRGRTDVRAQVRDRASRWWRSDAEGERDEHSLHTGDLGRLVDVDVRGHLENSFILASAVCREQLLDHSDGSAMVLHHVPEKQAVEVLPAGAIERVELRAREHARHQGIASRRAV